MRIVIIGASGNLGTAVLRAVQTRELPWEVVGVCRRLPPREAPYDVADWRRADVAADGAGEHLAEIFRGADAVVNLAWGFQPTRDARRLERVGVGGSAAMLDAAVRAGVGHVLQMSSVGAYGPGAAGRRVDESYPTDGIGTSVYSRHKAAVEHLLDDFEREQPDILVTRFRPGLVMQRAAGSALLRYAVPGYLPAGLIRRLPLLPVDRSLVVPVVHADDVASAVIGALQRRAPGAFNLAAEPPMTRDDIAAVLHARPVHLPAAWLRAVVAATWHVHLQRLDAGWIDLAFGVPLLDTSKARAELDWQPLVDAKSALAEAISGMAAAASTGSPVLRRRTMRAQLRELLQTGPITRRELP